MILIDEKLNRKIDRRYKRRECMNTILNAVVWLGGTLVMLAFYAMLFIELTK